MADVDNNLGTYKTPSGVVGFKYKLNTEEISITHPPNHAQP